MGDLEAVWALVRAVAKDKTMAQEKEKKLAAALVELWARNSEPEKGQQKERESELS